MLTLWLFQLPKNAWHVVSPSDLLSSWSPAMSIQRMQGRAACWTSWRLSRWCDDLQVHEVLQACLDPVRLLRTGTASNVPHAGLRFSLA